MHELSLMDQVRCLVLEEAARHRARRVEGINLRIGSLAGVDPDALRFAFDVVMAGTIAAGARLGIETVAAECLCDPCGRSFPAIDGGCECPDCGTISLQLLRGRELQLASLELD
jgi:hydrogenase nickel incorporation protein HypA/HybF